MPDYRYLIIGGGMTADAAVRGIREVDAARSVGLLSAEHHPPYNRPPLSKGLWKGEAADSIGRGTDKQAVELHLGRKATTLDARAKRVTDDRGTVFGYEKLLLATGGAPRRLPFGGEDVIYFRTFDDYQRVRALADRGARFAVVGGGFIGSEIAAALRMSQRQVTMLFPEEGIGARVFPRELSRFLADYYREKGVEVLSGDTIVGLEKVDDGLAVKTRGGRDLTVDSVVAGLGIQPGIELAQAAGLTVDNGIVVDETLRTSNPDIYAAGDVAAFHSPVLGTRTRVEHEDNANTMGRLAGQAMAGAAVKYHHLPSFYSDLFDLGYEAVGELDSRLETVVDWKQPFKEGVIYYLKDRRVRGVLLWNTWGQVDAARQLIGERGPFKPGDLKGRLPAAGS